MQWLAISTMNRQSFAELAFSFDLTPMIALQPLAFALPMGLLPAVQAARMDVVDALRAP